MARYPLNKLIRTRAFDSLNAYQDFLRTEPATMDRDASENTDNPSWYATDSYRDAERLLKGGWSEGLRLAQKMTDQINEGITPVEIPVAQPDVVGAFPIMPLVMAGEPECMYNPRAEVELPTIRIIVNYGMLGNVEPEQTMARGVAVMALIAKMERLGIRCELLAYKATSASHGDRGRWQEHTIKIKAHDQPCDLGTMAYCFAHPSANRRHGFRWIETTPQRFSRQFYRGMGRSVDLTETEGAERWQYDLYFPVVQAGTNSTDPLREYRRVHDVAEAAGLIEKGNW